MYPSQISKVEKIMSDSMYNATCIHCGSVKDIQLWPHRNGQGKMVGFVFACSSCEEIVKGVRFFIEGIRAPSENNEERRDSEQQTNGETPNPIVQAVRDSRPQGPDAPVQLP